MTPRYILNAGYVMASLKPTATPPIQNQENIMNIDYLFAAVVVTDIDASADFYTKFLGRQPDDKPMPTLFQWRGFSNAGIQLFEDASKAGNSMMTIIVSDVEKMGLSLKKQGIDVGKIQEEGSMKMAKLSDPDGNLIFLAEPPEDDAKRA